MRIDKAGWRDPSQAQRRFAPKLMMLGALGIVAASTLLVPEMALSAEPLGGPGTPMSPVPALKPSIPQAPVPSNAPIAPVISAPHVLGGSSGTPTNLQGFPAGAFQYTGTMVKEGDQYFITDMTTNVKYTLTPLKGKAMDDRVVTRVGKKVQIVAVPEGSEGSSDIICETAPPPHSHAVLLSDVD